MHNNASPKTFPWRIFYRVVLIQSTLLVAALASSGLTARYFFKRQFLTQARTQLEDALRLLSHNIGGGADSGWCAVHSKETTLRFTLIYPTGEVLCDSYGGGVENQAKFPEVDSAIKKGLSGADAGNSPKPAPLNFRADLRDEVLYGALALPNHQLVLRGAIPVTRLSQTMTILDTSLGFSLFFVAIALGFLAVWSARRLVFPLGRLLVKTQSIASHQPVEVSKEDLSRETFDEWADLESHIDDIRRDLAAKTQTLTREQVELETIMGAISDAILAVDPDGSPLFFNSRFELVFGNQVGIDGLRQRQLKLWGIFRDPEILNAFQGALREGRVGATRAIAVDQSDGARRYFSLSVSPLRKQSESIYGAVGIFHDVTELKSAEQMRIDFVANVSHELRTPLTVIKGYADTLLADEPKGSPTHGFLESMTRNADRLMNLMNDLLDLSSIESDSIIQKDPLSTEDITNRILNQLRGAFDGKDQKVTTRFAASTVYADAQRLEQVLVNLLGNANKYTPAGGQIFVTWEAAGNSTLLKVTDTGPGIPVLHHSRLFERFYRIDKSRSRDQGGTGLGLAIVKHIMQRHEGIVWLESQAGQGSTFLCRFPVPDAE